MTTHLIQADRCALRLMRDHADDYATLARWLTDARVLEFYEGRDNPFPLARVRKEYAPRVQRKHATVPCFMLFDNVTVGYLQYQPTSGQQLQEFALPHDARAFGIDMFIGEPLHWNSGFGTLFMQLALRYLADVHHATHVTVDPRVDNPRAIRCYEKCGFQQHLRLPRHELHEGVHQDAWLMVYSVSSRPHHKITTHEH